MAIGTALLFFLSLLLHEMAHSLVATANGLPVKEITLFALGGVSQITKEPATAKIEFRMALAGPLTSAVIGATCLAAAHLAGGGVPSPPVTILQWLGYINCTLAIFNLIPGYPLDGGRILRAIVWWITGDANRSTRLASRSGQFVGFAFILFGMVRYFGGGGIGALWMAFIGWFLLQAARESYLRVGLAGALSGVSVANIMTRDCATADAWLNLQNFVESELLPTGRRCFVVMENGTVAGLVTPHEIKHVERAKWPYTTLRDVMRPIEDVRTVTPQTPLTEALEMMNGKDLNQLPVIADGHLEGMLSRTDLLRYLRTRLEFQR